MKKTISVVVLLLVALTFVFAGCGGGTRTPSAYSKFEKLYEAVSAEDYVLPTKLTMATTLQRNNKVSQVAVYNYGSELSEEKRLKIGDDVSALHITESGYLVCSTWNGMKLHVYNLESGEVKEFGSNLVVRSICEVDGVIYDKCADCEYLREKEIRD